MIPLDKLIPAATLRYDEDGEPLYTRPERVLRALNRLGEVSSSDLYDDLGADGRERVLFSSTLRQLVETKRVTVRLDRGLRLYQVASVQPVKERCGCTSDRRCDLHAEINRMRAREAAKRKAKAEGRVYVPRNKEPWMCHECRERAVEGTTRCEYHTEVNRERARRAWERQKQRRVA